MWVIMNLCLRGVDSHVMEVAPCPIGCPRTLANRVFEASGVAEGLIFFLCPFCNYALVWSASAGTRSRCCLQMCWLHQRAVAIWNGSQMKQSTLQPQKAVRALLSCGMGRLLKRLATLPVAVLSTAMFSRFRAFLLHVAAPVDARALLTQDCGCSAECGAQLHALFCGYWLVLCL